MSFWSRKLGWRLAAAFAGSVVAIVALAFVAEGLDKPPKPTKRARKTGTVEAVGFDDGSLVYAAETGEVEPMDGESSSAGDAARASLGQRSPSAPATLAKALGFRVQPTSGTVMVTHRLGSLAPDIAPVVEILPTGEVALRRPMPVALGPGKPAPLSRQGHGAGVILPANRLDQLGPAPRAALVGLLQLWFTERPIAPARLRSNDLELPRASLVRLLSWVP